jgi:formiminoglutamase
MEFELSFSPVEFENQNFQEDQLGKLIETYTKGNFPDLTEADVVIIGVPEYRGSDSNGDESSLMKVRNEIHQLYQGQERLRIADLGNLLIGEKTTDTFQLLADVLEECERRGYFSLLIGGGQDATFSQYKSCVQQNKMCNMVVVDSEFDLGLNNQNLSANSYLNHVLNFQPNLLFNFSNIGYQSYLVSQQSIKLIDDLFFDSSRIGEIRKSLEEIEPIVRNADFISVDMKSIRLSDSPAVHNGSPNGFYGEEICQLMRYAGTSGSLKSLGIYEYNSMKDLNDASAKLIAQMIWCFFEGFFHKMKNIKPTDKDMVKYHVSMRKGEYNACFYKNKKLNKWWMQIPLLISSDNQNLEHHCFVPCSYNDYIMASEGNIPDRWWKVFQKMN